LLEIPPLSLKAESHPLSQDKEFSSMCVSILRYPKLTIFKLLAASRWTLSRDAAPLCREITIVVKGRLHLRSQAALSPQDQQRSHVWNSSLSFLSFQGNFACWE
jgi:hypothetical protein